MTFDPALFDPTQLCLELDRALQTQTWQHQSLATPQSRWNAYLNQLCLHTLLPWFHEDYPQAKPTPNAASLASFWEWVNGTAIALGNTRLLLLPTEAIDGEEFRVPQEWIDIPGWVADYYLSVQVNPDDGWLRVNGFTTHRQLKTQGRYDWRDRTYSLDETDLIPDLNALWVSRQLAPTAPTRAAVAAIAPLPLAQAENLIQRLGNPTLPTPQFSIPFETWAALVQHGGWRQRLAEQRRGLPESRSIGQWLQAGVSQVAQQLGWSQVSFQLSAGGARGEEEQSMVRGVSRSLSIADQPYELRILPTGIPGVWRFELRSLLPGGQIPAGVALRLLSEDLQPFTGNEDVATTAVEELYIEVALEPGEGLVWAIDPMPEDYDQEILRF
jgi:Protein of unknown function (DUF1822)